MFGKNKNIMVKVPIAPMRFEDGNFSDGDRSWRPETLYNFAKAKEYPTIEIPLCAIDLGNMPFDCSDLAEFIFQCKRVRSCSLDYPIILDDKGCIADGYHRVCRAILEGKETIKAIRLLEMPSPDHIKQNK